MENLREQKGIIIAAFCKLSQVDGVWHVPSQTSAKKTYSVDPERQTCSCADNEDGNKCKHLYAVEIAIKRERIQQVELAETLALSFTEKKSYKQDWQKYNLAQTIEKSRFQVLLQELCRGVEPFPQKPGRGRKKSPASNAVFAAVFKVYSRFSCRRFSSDLEDAHTKGHVTRPVHYNTVCRFLENPELTPRLHALIRESSRPLNVVESVFAVDSTGFSGSRFDRWYDEKNTVKRSGRRWVKAHVICGVRTHAVTAVVIEARNAADAPQFRHLLDATAQNFKIVEVSGDKAYLSEENIQAVFQAGGIPYIAFKKNSTGAAGGFFEKSFHYYSMNRDEFLERYHQRSNVESTFAAIKAKFGDSVRSQTDTAMMNEVLCKILCQNITCLIHSQCELGIEPRFWGETPKRSVS